MNTILYLIRHGATELNVARPYRLQGRRSDPPLCPLGVEQAVRARDVLAGRPVAAVYSSPLARALQSARIVAEPHGCDVGAVEALSECDIGDWERLTWDEVRERDPRGYEQFHADPGKHGYAGGETFHAVQERVVPALRALARRHCGHSVAVVAHKVVIRVALACVLGIPLRHAKRIRLANGGISVLCFEDEKESVATLNAAFHLAGVEME